MVSDATRRTPPRLIVMIYSVEEAEWRAFPDDGARRGAVARRQDCIGGVPARSVTRAAALHARL